MPSRISRFPVVPLLVSLCAAFALAQPTVGPDDGDTRVVELWAGPEMVSNPVAIGIDWSGNIYVAESDRAGNAVTDTRQLEHLDAVIEDLKLRSVEDRRALIERWIEAGHFEPDYFTRTEDRLRVLRDTDRDGLADDSTVFAGGFNDAVDGIAAGALWHDGKLYFTNIPHLWVLEDTDGDWVAETHEPISSGYGVRWCFYGHDLHGPTLGPEGRIYFSIGDRGYNVESQEGERFVGVDRGAVFRCWPDGSELELVHEGLRNPQDLTFDEFGNWFTGDNNCDSGDKARVVHIVEGGDSGWRQDVQSLPSRGPWNREHIWELGEEHTLPARPAWTLPPVAHVGAGPSGIAYYPGTGENAGFDDTILMVDFYGSGSTIHQFQCVPDGAGFGLQDRRVYYKGVTVTDIAWGYDGRLYCSDWGEGWGPNDKGNVFTITNETVHANEDAREVIDEIEAIYDAGFRDRDEAELVEMLAHHDQRVRLDAHHELASRGAIDSLSATAADASAPVLQRVHAIWGLWEIGGKAASRDGDDELRMAVIEPLRPLLRDEDPQIRAQAAKVLGDLRVRATGDYARLLDDTDAQAQFYAAIALGRTREAAAIDPLLGLLERNDNEDATLRHAASLALSRIAGPEELVTLAEFARPPARLGIVLALRRLESPSVVAFLSDEDPIVQVEAARAIYDKDIRLALPALAALLDADLPSEARIEPLMRRAIEANRLLATDASALRLARFAARADADEAWRPLALRRLAEWDQPLPREGVWGHWVDLGPGSLSGVQAEVAALLPTIFDLVSNDEEMAELAGLLEAALGLEADPAMLALFARDAEAQVTTRAMSLERLARADPDEAQAIARDLLDAGDGTPERLRMSARRVLVETDPASARPVIARGIDGGSIEEKRHALHMLASLGGAWTREVIRAVADSIISGSLDPALALDVRETAGALGADAVVSELDESLGDSLDRSPAYADAYLGQGGDPESGERLFRSHPAAQCFRCHMVEGEGGVSAPELSAVASRLTTPLLIESVVEPAAVITPGFGSVSAMPTMTDKLSPRETRDVIAYLRARVDPDLGPADEQTIPTTGAGSRMGSAGTPESASRAQGVAGAGAGGVARRAPSGPVMSPVLLVFGGATLLAGVVILIPVLVVVLRPRQNP